MRTTAGRFDRQQMTFDWNAATTATIDRADVTARAAVEDENGHDRRNPVGGSPLFPSEAGLLGELPAGRSADPSGNGEADRAPAAGDGDGGLLLGEVGRASELA